MTARRRPSAAASGRTVSAGSFASDWRMGCGLLLLVWVGSLFLPGPWILLTPLLVLGAMLGVWWRRGRDPSRLSVAPRYEPPEGLSPGEVGILVDHSLDLRDVTASLVDLTNRGLLEIEELDGGSVEGAGPAKDYVFRRTSEPQEWERLRPQERHLLYTLFKARSFSRVDMESVDAKGVLRGLLGGRPSDADLSRLSTRELFRLGVTRGADWKEIARALYGRGRHEVRMSELKDDFLLHVDGMRLAYLDRLVELGYYARRPGGRRGIYLLTGLLAFCLVSVIAREPMIGIVAGLLAAAAIVGLGWVMPARTRKGSRALAQALGFREFLARVEEDRFRRMIRSPREFEQYLPYAMALGVESEWSATFHPIYGVDRELDWTELRERLSRTARPSGFARRRPAQRK